MIILQIQLNFTLLILLLISPLVPAKWHHKELFCLPLDCKFYKLSISAGGGRGAAWQNCSHFIIMFPVLSLGWQIVLNGWLMNNWIDNWMEDSLWETWRYMVFEIKSNMLCFFISFLNYIIWSMVGLGRVVASHSVSGLGHLATKLLVHEVWSRQWMLFENKHRHCWKPRGTIDGGRLWGNLIIKFKFSIKFIDSLKLKKIPIFKKFFFAILYWQLRI